jgi:hypothetical protein
MAGEVRTEAVRRPREAGSRHRAAVALAAVLLSTVGLWWVPGRPVAAESEGGLRLLGPLPEPPEATLELSPLFVDREHRALYASWQGLRGDVRVVGLAEYDLKPAVPALRRALELGPALAPSGQYLRISPYQSTLDSRRRRLLALDVYNATAGTNVRRVDLVRFRIEETWRLDRELPGFVAIGITYAPQDDRVYLLGVMLGHVSVQDLFTLALPPPLLPTLVVALDAASGHVVWVRSPLPDCWQPVYNFVRGGFVGRSATRDALYFFCYPGQIESDSLFGVGPDVQYSAPTGLARLSIAPRAGQREALSFPLEFFPVSGSYRFAGDTAVIGMDHPTDRVFVQSLSRTTPGAWVFDGEISAWVGLIAAPANNDTLLAVNERNGHYYMGGPANDFLRLPAFLIVSNARLTPPPQGQLFSFPVEEVFADPTAGRLFLWLRDANGELHWWVFEDRTPDPVPPETVDYDARTTDVPEGPGTVVASSGSLSGFGSHVFLAGGLGGATSAVSLDPVFSSTYDPRPALQALQARVPIPALKPGDRGLYFGRVARVDLRESGSSASAQAAAPDSLTDADLQNLRNTSLGQVVADTPAEGAAGAFAPAEQALRRALEPVAWPYPAATCLDGGGTPLGDAKRGLGGDAQVRCDLARARSVASASFGPFRLGPLTVAASSTTATSRKDPTLGAVTEIVSEARGVEAMLPGLGGFSIGRVRAVARSQAHGRPGTARATYERRIQDVRVLDASGREVFACASCRPEQVADVINGRLGAKLRVDVPPAEVLATPRGAFAGVRKTYRDYWGGLVQNNDDSYDLPALQVTLNNDTASKSRLVVQLAGVQASSIYGISLLGGAERREEGPAPGPPGGPGQLPPGGNGGGGGEQPGLLGLPPTPGGAPARRPGRIVGAFLLSRAPREAALVALIFGLVAASVAAGRRRQRLVERVGGGA